MNIDALSASVEDLKRDLPIPFVMEYYNHRPVGDSYGRLHYINPWREDTNPSLDVFSNNGVQRAGDFAEGWQGSVLDVVGRFEEIDDFASILTVARTLYGDFLSSGWDGPSIGEASAESVMDEDAVERVQGLKRVSRRNANQALVDMLSSKPGVDLDTLRTFGVRTDNDRLAILYPDGRAIRYRWEDGSKTFERGSKPGLYYQADEEPLNDRRPVLVVEGETDCWAAFAALEGHMQVVSIPGVGHQPARHMGPLVQRQVVLCFDGDVAGRDGAKRWADALTKAGSTVSIVPMPDGRDVASLPRADFLRLLRLRRGWSKNNSGLVATNEGYAVEGAKREEDRKYVSNWVALPTRLLAYDDDRPRTYEVEVTLSGQPVSGRSFLLRAEDLSSSAKLHRWASQFSGAWWGGQTDHQKLRAVLEEMATFLPVDQATSSPGLVGSAYVWPGGSTGGNVTCVQDPTRPLTEPSAFELHEHDGAGPTTLLKLLGMHRPEVVWPMLAWYAVAPLRSRFGQFPPLFVTGPAGSGKTTLVAELTRIFSGVQFMTNLTTTTPYALALTMGSTNAFPTWFDEYRPGARKATMDIMDQLLRDAYNKAPSRRGGLGANPSEITVIRTDNPLVVSGEDFADELSHRDRLIKVFIPTTGRGELPLWTDQDRGFAYDYLSWLTEHDPIRGGSRIDTLPQVEFDAYLELGLTNRQAYNLGVLDLGLDLLRDYVYDRVGHDIELPDCSWASLLLVAQEEAGSDPVLELIRTRLEAGNSNSLWLDEDEGHIFVSCGQILNELNRDGAVLPFRTPRALYRYVQLKLGGEPVTERNLHGRKTRYLRLANPWPDEIG